MLAYRVAGTGKPVLLVHGFTLNRSIWDAQVAYLAARYQVITPDLPGHGETPPVADGEPVTISGMARELLTLMDRLGIQQAALAGHSMGGYVALALQKQAPERLSGLALVCTQARADTPEARQGRLALAERVAQEGPEPVAAALGPKLFAPEVGPEHPLYQAGLSMIRGTSAAGLRGALLAMAEREDHRPRLGSIDLPALVLAGAADQLIPPDRSDEMAAAIPGATLVKVAGAGHMPMLERPEAVNQALDQWLRRVYGE